MKQIYFYFSLALSIFSFNEAKAVKYKVISREATHGGLFGYDYVNSDPVTYYTETNGTQVAHIGYEVTCRQPGTTSCPKLGHYYRPANPTDGWDQTQINKADELMQYAIDQIDQGYTTGSFSINVQVQGEPTLRVYEVTWDSSIGKIEITREASQGQEIQA